MKKNIIIGLVAVFAMALVASAALASPGFGRGMGDGPDYGVPPVSNLTLEQSTKIQALTRANLKEITSLQEQFYAKKTELGTLWASQTPDQARINVLQKDIFELMDLLQPESTVLRADMLGIIVP